VGLIYLALLNKACMRSDIVVGKPEFGQVLVIRNESLQSLRLFQDEKAIFCSSSEPYKDTDLAIPGMTRLETNSWGGHQLL
jgi:hypothetical protein